jgi:hypothetical protein
VIEVTIAAVMPVRRPRTTTYITWYNCKAEMANPRFLSLLSAIDFGYLNDPEEQGSLVALQAKYSVDQMNRVCCAASMLLLKLGALQKYAVCEECFKVSQLEGVVTKLLRIESLGAA